MRCAVIVALGDPRSSDAGTWIDAVTWLRQELTEFVFRVSVIEGENVERDLARALAEVTPRDDVLFHISGRLVERGVVRTAGGRKIRLETLGNGLAARPAASVSLFAEFVYDGADDALVGAEHVASIVEAFHARARGYATVAAVRAASAAIDGLALTRLFLGVARTLEPQGALLCSAVYDRIAGKRQSLACAQSFAFIRGAAERALSPSMPSAPDNAAAGDERPLAERIAHATEACDWRGLVALRRERLGLLESTTARVRELLAIARILQVNLDDAAGALEALEQARVIDPMRVGVIQALRRGYERLGRWEDAFEAIGALADLSPLPPDRAELRLAQARVALDKFNDKERAFALLQSAVDSDPAHERALAAYRALYDAHMPAANVPPTAAAEALREPHASAFSTHLREGRTDAAFLAAMALNELGAADTEHKTLIDQLRSLTPIRARATLDRPAWHLLRAPGSNEVLEALFTDVAAAALATRVEQLAERRRLVALDPASRLDPSSTSSVVRSFQWTARVLGVACPALYAVDEVPGEIAAVRGAHPSTAVGPSVLGGRSAKDLAYLAGRHLTYYRPEHQVLIYFPTRDELATLLMAAVDLGAPRRKRASRDPAVIALRERLERHTTRAERASISAAGHDLDVDADLGTWARSVELTASRAGLLLCGDLSTATAIIGSESRAIAGVSAEDRRDDLIAFCSSPQHASLRSRFAIPAHESGQQAPTTASSLHSP